MDVFCDRLKFDSTAAAIDCHTGQNKGRYGEKEVLLLLVWLYQKFRLWDNKRMFSDYCLSLTWCRLTTWESESCKKGQVFDFWSGVNCVQFIVISLSNLFSQLFHWTKRLKTQHMQSKTINASITTWQNPEHIESWGKRCLLLFFERLVGIIRLELR